MNSRAAMRPAPLLAAILLTALLAGQPSGIFGTYDFERMHEPYREDFRAAILAGEWPWWNPYTALGRPYFADVETAMLYPATWLAIPFGVNGGILLTIVLHFALAIRGTQRLAEHLRIRPVFALIAGISFALSGALFSRIQSGQIQFFCVVCLWPWIWVSALRLQDAPGLRPMLVTTAWLAVAFLAGSPQILWCGLVGLVPLLVARAVGVASFVCTFAWLAAAGSLALSLVAVQFLPFVELIHEGNRPLHDSLFATRFGQGGLSWLSLVVPPGPWLRVNWEFNLHVGAIALIGAAAVAVQGWRNRDARGLAVAGVCMFALSLGEHSPVLPALAEWVPGFSSVRYPSRYGLAGVLSIALLFGLWLERLNDATDRTRRFRSGTIALHLVALAIGVFTQGSIYRSLPTPRHEALIRADATSAGLPRDGAPPRAMLPESLLRANGGASAGVSTLVGFNNPALARTWTSLYRLAGEELPDFHRTNVIDAVQGKLWDHRGFFSVSIDAAPPEYRVNYHVPIMPRAFVAYRVREVNGWDEALSSIATGHDFVRQPLVEQPVSLAASGSAVPTAATITGFSRNGITVATNGGEAGLLVVGEAWYPGWTASIDGSAARVLPVNGWMRGVAVPSGVHVVQLEYRPKHLVAGALLSIAALGIFAALWRRAATASAQTGI